MSDKTKNNDELVGMMSAGSNSREIFSYPVLAHDHVVYVGPLDYPEDQLEKIQLIRTASPDDTIRLIINSPGGYVSLAMAFISAINESAAKIVTHAEGTVASAGTLLWLAGEDRTVSPMTEFMFHNYQGDTWGDGANMFSQITFAKERFDRVIRRFYTNVLTEEEIQRIIGGGQIWLDDEQMVERTGATLLSKEYLRKKREEYGMAAPSEKEPTTIPYEVLGEDKAQKKDKGVIGIRFTLEDGEDISFDAENISVDELNSFYVKDLLLMVRSLAAELGVDVKTYGVTSKSNKTALVSSFLQLAKLVVSIAKGAELVNDGTA